MAEDVIIGLTGRFGAGCSVTSKYFEKSRSFSSYHLSAFLKKSAKETVKDFESKPAHERRKILQDIGDKLRQATPSALVEPIIDDIKKNDIKNAVIECIRNPKEIERLKEVFGDRFFLISVDAETEIRWKRLQPYYMSRNEFDVNDKRDEGKGQPEYGQKVKDCMLQADVCINSNYNFFDEKQQKDHKVIDMYAQKLSDYIGVFSSLGNCRPPYPDELYMQHACTVALQSRCSKRQVGAVIVKEIKFPVPSDEKNALNTLYGNHGFVVSTGCNNVPPGEQACSDKNYKGEDCYRGYKKKSFFDKHLCCRNCGNNLNGKMQCDCGYDNSKLPGKLLDLCRAVHAEEAAILQAARLGSTELAGTKLYTSAFPCMLCCKKIIAAGIKEVVYLESYPMEESLALDMFKRCSVKILKYEGVNFKSYFKFFEKKFTN